MTLRVNSLSGVGGGRNASVALTISASTNNYIVSTAVAAAGGSIATAGLQVYITLANGVIVGSTSTSVPAFRTGGGWAAGCGVHVLVPSGSARIQGKGGAGGNGRERGNDSEGFCDSIGSFHGGGGGGAGTQAGAGGNDNGSAGTATAGGAGATHNGGGDCNAAGAQLGGAGGHALEATSGGPNVFLEPAAGQTLEVWGGGGGGGGSASAAVAGGAGGGPGLDGAASGSGGGANGLAYSTPGAATITEVGPGTIDDRGV